MGNLEPPPPIPYDCHDVSALDKLTMHANSNTSNCAIFSTVKEETFVRNLFSRILQLRKRYESLFS